MDYIHWIIQNVQNPKYKLINTIRIALTWNTILPDQINNLLQHQIFLLQRESDRKRPGNKAVDVLVYTIPAARVDMPIHGRLNVIG